MMKEKPQVQDIHYGIYIPAKVKMDLKISAMAKLLYGEILALAQLDGVCESNNRYFADIYNIKKHQASPAAVSCSPLRSCMALWQVEHRLTRFHGSQDRSG